MTNNSNSRIGIDKNFLCSSMLCNQNKIDDTIYKRSYLITIKYEKLNNTKSTGFQIYNQMESMYTIFYLKIVSAINPLKKHKGNEVASILIGADVEATKINKGKFYNPEIPHFHIVLVVTQEEYDRNINNIDEMENRIKNGLESIDKINEKNISLKCNAHLKKFDINITDSSFDKMFSYAYKAYEQSFGLDIDFPFPGVFPYQLDVDRDRKLKGNGGYDNIQFKKMMENRDRIMSLLKFHDCNIASLLESVSLNKLDLN